MDDRRPMRVGGGTEDWCRVCKMERRHTVEALDPNGRARVRCDTCSSLHDYRGGGPRPVPAAPAAPRASNLSWAAATDWPAEPRAPGAAHEEIDVDSETLERLLRKVIREEGGMTPAAPADRWRGGELVMRPGRPGLQEKTLPIETFFAKIVMLRNRLRVLEQQVNGSDVPDDLKLKLQGYITACYGSLTTFNVLFADEADRFKGSGGAAND